MNESEIEFFLKSDITWHKKTKKFGSQDNFFNVLWNNALNEKVNIFGSEDFKEFKKSNLSQTDKDALEIMGLNYTSSWEDVQKKFKKLVKKYHPDKNHGNKILEDKLKKNNVGLYSVKK